MNVLFVCTGNTCRSPMAEALLKHRAPADINVKSCGMTAIPGAPASDQTTEVLKQQGIEINHQASPISEELVQWADLILTMTVSHKERLWTDYPKHRKKTYTLKEFALGADIEIWNQLEMAYADLEEKREQCLQKYDADLDPGKRNQLLFELCQPEFEKINYLKRQLIHSDIADPFGGPIAYYLETKEEIEACLDKWLSSQR
ncbi:low molecular weight protein arginine phosphatase [Oceanobacillus sp. J11TS1]|uniref:low molecular weight protein arginine phosphatase n=1 Tax=Oceanobacillus sp. J11TS1 TaxID=2807191 RepID=UPI001B2440BF|nr:low molecular weight protein arginine phosphatase [Oceanobacillus sp. J11TS1]GIO24732.1 protein-tyrosine-phosphatase [Oceanobacillus sp. J11TS1]